MVVLVRKVIKKLFTNYKWHLKTWAFIWKLFIRWVQLCFFLIFYVGICNFTIQTFQDAFSSTYVRKFLGAQFRLNFKFHRKSIKDTISSFRRLKKINEKIQCKHDKIQCYFAMKLLNYIITNSMIFLVMNIFLYILTELSIWYLLSH